MLRTQIPLVQVPSESAWSYPGNAKFTLAEVWLKQSITPADAFRELALRYVAAFGPATVNDLHTWSVLPRAADVPVKQVRFVMPWRARCRRFIRICANRSNWPVC